MTESPDTTEEQASPVPTPAVETPTEKTPKEPQKKESGFPVGQAAVGGLGAVTLGSYALASVVGPVGWLAAPAAAGVAGAGYVAYRHSKKRGKRGGRRRSERRTRTIRRTSGGKLRMGSPSLGGRGRASAPSAARTGGVGAPTRGRSAGLGGASALKGVGSKPGSSGRSSRGASPRGGGLRGSSPRSSSPRGGSTPRGGGGGLFGRRTPGSTSSKGKTTPPTRGMGKSTSPRTSGGSMSKTRWGGSSGPTAKPAGRLRRAGRTAGSWADRKTGQRASTAFKAARKEKGFCARSKAASKAVRKKGGGRIVSGAVGVIAALFAPRRKKSSGRSKDDLGAPAGWYAKDGYKLGDPVPGHPGSFYADPNDRRPGYVDRAGLGPDHPGYTTGSYDANVDPRSWGERVAAGDVPGFNPKTSSTHSGGTTMTGLPAARISDEMTSAMARYTPADAHAVVHEFKEWPTVVANVALSVKLYADHLESARFPLDAATKSKLRDLYQALRATEGIAEELYPLVRKIHDMDIARRETPRGDESKWNV